MLSCTLFFFPDARPPKGRLAPLFPYDAALFSPLRAAQFRHQRLSLLEANLPRAGTKARPTETPQQEHSLLCPPIRPEKLQPLPSPLTPATIQDAYAPADTEPRLKEAPSRRHTTIAQHTVAHPLTGTLRNVPIRTKTVAH